MRDRDETYSQRNRLTAFREWRLLEIEVTRNVLLFGIKFPQSLIVRLPLVTQMTCDLLIIYIFNPRRKSSHQGHSLSTDAPRGEEGEGDPNAYV